MTDRAATLSVLAKEPRPGRVKTRLHSEFTPVEAADLAAAAIKDTVAGVLRVPAVRRVVVWDGPDARWRDRFAAAGLHLLDQRPGTLNDRLTGAFADRPARTDEPHLLVGMDTPQLSPTVLAVDWEGADAVLGLCPDGGFWAIGLRGVDPAACFAGIPMSTDRTGAAQLNRLVDLGCTVKLLPPLRDVDEPADAEAVAYEFPHLGFSARYRRITEARATQPVHRLFDLAYAGAPLRVDTAGESTLRVDLARWSGPANDVDALLVARCEPPVLDLGCGPGRLVRALSESGRSALGVDVSAEAVASQPATGGAGPARGGGRPAPGRGTLAHRGAAGRQRRDRRRRVRAAAAVPAAGRARRAGPGRGRPRGPTRAGDLDPAAQRGGHLASGALESDRRRGPGPGRGDARPLGKRGMVGRRPRVRRPPPLSVGACGPRQFPTYTSETGTLPR